MNTEYTKNIALTEEEYVKPRIEIIEVENEGILAASSGFGSSGGFGPGGGFIDPFW